MVDIATCVPLLVGIVGSTDDGAPPVPASGTALRALLTELRARSPGTPIVVLAVPTSPAERDAVAVVQPEALAVVELRDVAGDPRDAIADVSDLLVVVSAGPAPADLRAIAERRERGEPVVHSARRLLAPADVGPYALIEGETVRSVYPARFAGDTDSERDFTFGLARRSRFNADLAAAPPATDGTPLQRLRTRTAALTRQMQHHSHVAHRFLYAMAFIAATTQILSLPSWVFIKALVVAIAFGVYLIVRRGDYQNRYWDYRAIAEALRVQTVWSSIGITDGAEECYLPMQQTDLQWIRYVVRAARFFEPAQSAPDGSAAVLRWVDGQRNYFRDHWRGEGRLSARFGVVAFALGALSFTASIVTFGALHFKGEPLFVYIGMLAAWTALCVAIARSYSRARGFSENANRYQRMFFVFEKGMTLLQRPGRTDADLRAVVGELGREALTENAEWLLMQRERPIEFVQTDVG